MAKLRKMLGMSQQILLERRIRALRLSLELIDREIGKVDIS